jgi:hypothetical protein
LLIFQKIGPGQIGDVALGFASDGFVPIIGDPEPDPTAAEIGNDGLTLPDSVPITIALKCNGH